MGLLTNSSTMSLWQDVVKYAETRCSITLQSELEAYLISLLMRYTNQPQAAKHIVATSLLDALHLHHSEREVSLQRVGDQCLLFTGLFPRIAEKRHVKINYFVDVGRSAYSAISHTTSDLYGTLALQFVVLMDVLQSIRPDSNLMPLEAYERWDELGSQRALKILQDYTNATPLKK